MGQGKKVELNMYHIHNLKKNGYTYKSISEIYNCSPTTISRRYRNWKDDLNLFQRFIAEVKVFFLYQF